MIGETNVVQVQRAVRRALDELADVAWELNEVDMLYAVRARRGPYSSDGNGDESVPDVE